MIRIWVGRGEDATIRTLATRRTSLVRRVGVAVISLQVWYLDSAPPRKKRVRTVLRSSYRMHVVIVLYDTAVAQRTSMYRTFIWTNQYVILVGFTATDGLVLTMPTYDTLVMICEGNQYSIVCLADGSELLDTYPVEVKEQTST